LLVGVVSDTHLSGKPVPESLKEALSGVDIILHAGDIVEMDVLDELSEIAGTYAVRGNMDRGEAARLLPESRLLDLEGFKVGLTHGSGPPSGIIERVRRAFDRVDCVVFGHTHQPVILRKDGVLFFNPGSPTDRKFTETNAVGFLELTDRIEPRILYLDGGDSEGGP
jgi:putative phosphoesterase